MSAYTLCILDFVMHKYSEWIGLGILVRWPVDHDCVIALLPRIAEVKNHRILLGIQGRDLPVTEFDDVNQRGSIDIIFDELLQMGVCKQKLENIWLEMPWSHKNNRVVFRECKSVLVGVFLLFDSCDWHPLGDVCALHFVDHKVHLLRLHVEH